MPSTSYSRQLLIRNRCLPPFLFLFLFSIVSSSNFLIIFVQLRGFYRSISQFSYFFSSNTSNVFLIPTSSLLSLRIAPRLLLLRLLPRLESASASSSSTEHSHRAASPGAARAAPESRYGQISGGAAMARSSKPRGWDSGNLPGQYSGRQWSWSSCPSYCPGRVQRVDHQSCHRRPRHVRRCPRWLLLAMALAISSGPSVPPLRFVEGSHGEFQPIRIAASYWQYSAVSRSAREGSIGRLLVVVVVWEAGWKRGIILSTPVVGRNVQEWRMGDVLTPINLEITGYWGMVPPC